jgi:hypothetical protein
MSRRHSAEGRAGSFYRAGGRPAQAPAGMSAFARRVWREIIASKPLDWFDGDALHELRVHCENRARLNDLTRRSAKEDVGSKEFRELAVTMRVVSTMLTSSARQLRLTVQHKIDYQTTTMKEGGSALGSDLIGGAAKLRKVA